MCGIFGSINNNALKETYTGLKRLEYRGYDSFGYAALDGNTVQVKHQLGTLKDDVFNSDVQFGTAIGHVRWATHGEVSIENAHPQKSNGFYVVHNGTVNNAPHDNLDTKWIAQLLNQHHGNINFVCNTIDGDNAFVFINKEDGNVYCVAQGNKRLFVTNNGYVSSDLNALSGFSSTAHILQDGYCQLGTWFQKNIPVPKFIIEPVGEHMLDEIKQQATLDTTSPEIVTSDHVDIIATGSSLHAGMFGAYSLEQQGISTRCIHASQAPYYNLRDSVVAISQSGETKDIIGAVPKIFTCLTNTPHSMLCDMSEKNVFLDVGPEYAVAATKTFTMSCIKLGGPVASMGDQIDDLMGRGDEIQDIAGRIMGYAHFLFLGDEQNYPIALEVALKFKEVAYVHAEGMPASEMKHGPIALVDYKVPSLFIVTENFRPETISNIKEIKSRRGFVAIITHDAIKDQLEGLADIIFSCQDTGEKYSQSLVCNVVLQLLAYYIAIGRGMNPDKPKNLAKCVTV